MATNVLVIPEDFRKDQFVLRPIIKKMMAALGLTARVEVCMDPLLGGVGEALKWERLQEILAALSHDPGLPSGRRPRRESRPPRCVLDQPRRRVPASRLAGGSSHFFAENAWQEVEVWVLAGLTDVPKAWAWKDVRAERRSQGSTTSTMHARRSGRAGTGPYEGRGVLAEEAAANYPRIRQLCP
jgi:hypothetical protein